MTDPARALAILLVVFAVTYLLRLAPFLALRHVRDSPLLAYLGRTMPLGVMVILVVYTLREVDLTRPPAGLPELAGVAATAALHLWRRNTLLSIVGGTATYIAVAALG